MTERWWYTRGGQREGPVPRERLLDLVRAGWLGPRDLVWSEGMADWVPAGSLDWLFGGGVQRTVNDLLDAARHPRRHPLDPAVPRPPRRPLVDWDAVEPRHLAAVAGAVAAALGIAFTLIAPSALGWWLVCGGTVGFVAGLHVELGPHLLRLAGLAANAVVATVRRALGPSTTETASTGDATTPPATTTEGGRDDDGTPGHVAGQ